MPNGGFLDFLPLSIRDSPGVNLNYESQQSQQAVHRTGGDNDPTTGFTGPLHANPYPNTASPGSDAGSARPATSATTAAGR